MDIGRNVSPRPEQIYEFVGNKTGFEQSYLWNVLFSRMPSTSLVADDPGAVIRRLIRACLPALATDRVMEAWYHPSIARMTPNRRVTWQATSNDENS
jgi:hypothetical protein